MSSLPYISSSTPVMQSTRKGRNTILLISGRKRYTHDKTYRHHSHRRLHVMGGTFDLSILANFSLKRFECTMNAVTTNTIALIRFHTEWIPTTLVLKQSKTSNESELTRGLVVRDTILITTSITSKVRTKRAVPVCLSVWSYFEKHSRGRTLRTQKHIDTPSSPRVWTENL